jgi:23S rRNA (adenine2030-N6)-methyltransferase
MNYRHAFHAGNFADVLKHVILAQVIDHLKQKPAPFRVIDTHAGAGRYDLGSDAAQRTGEWRTGIGRLLAQDVPPAMAEILAPYLEAIRAENGGTLAPLARYPGSPAIARHLLRRSDQLVVNELHPDDHAALARAFAGDPQTKVLAIDGWTALRSLLPPKERRGVVLVDPPFEVPGDLSRLAEGLQDAVRRFETGIFLLWYPIKDAKRTRTFLSRLGDLGYAKLLAAELLIRRPADPDLLNGCGVAILNPPFRLAEKLGTALPYLADRLGSAAGAEGRLIDLGATQ